MTIPVTTSTRVVVVREMLAEKLGIDPYRIDFVVKQGSYHKKQLDTDEIRSKVLIKGISSFSRVRQEYSHPLCIIGCGHMGLRMALHLVELSQHNYVQIDRHNRVGGTSWLDHANKFSKIQTELGTYHLSWSEHCECPKGISPWPSRDALLEHFDAIADEKGMKAHMMMNTNIRSFDIHHVDPVNNIRYYDLHLEPVNSGDGVRERTASTLLTSAVYLFPGNLTKPRRETYIGEDVFDGSISYGMFDETDYDQISGKDVAIVGFGAFAVENVRTCIEHHAKKVYLVCRRKNLCMPRMVSWWINSSIYPVASASVLKAMDPIYEWVGDDPWTYWSVHSNEARTNVTIHQKARFGIGDIYFLARYYGKCEVVQGTVKKLTRNTMHLDSGRKLELNGILKLLGFVADWEVDRFMQIKRLTGFWADLDYRRGTVSEFPTVNAQRFSGTTLSPGLIAWCIMFEHMYHYPKDWNRIADGDLLPVNEPDKKKDKPAYVLDAKQGATVMIVLATVCPAMAERMAVYDDHFKRKKQWGTHSLEEVHAHAEAEWFHYCQQFYDEGDLRPFPPYPYSKEAVQEMIKVQDREGEAQLRAAQGRLNRN